MKTKLILVTQEHFLNINLSFRKELEALFELTLIFVTDSLSGDQIKEIQTIDRQVHFLVAMDSSLCNYNRFSVFSAVRSLGFKSFPFVSSSAKIGGDVTLGESCVVMAGVHIGTQVKVGYCSIIESGSEIGDQVAIGNNCFLGTRTTVGSQSVLANNVTLEQNSVIKAGVTIGKESLIKANQLVSESVAAGVFNSNLFDEPARIYSF